MYRGRLVPGDNFCDRDEARPDFGNTSSADFLGSTNQRKTERVNQPEPPAAHRAEGYRGKRIACVLVADFAIAAIARTNPELRERPFALIRMPTPRHSGNFRRTTAEYQPHSELSSVSTAARAAGLRPGMTVAQGRALIPDLLVLHPSPAAERSAADALLDMAESMSPVVEEGSPGCAWLDLSGMERLYRHSINSAAPDGVENSIAGEILRRARRLGLEAAAAIASSKQLAYLAARCGGARVIAAGMEREFLDWLPLDLVELEAGARGDEVELMLKRLGIRRLGDLARLDMHAVGSRFGRRGVELARLARGEGSATVIARARDETFTEAAEFDYGLENVEPLGFILHTMLTQLTERLKMRGLAAGDMRLSLGLTDRRRNERRVPVAAATVEVRSLLALLKLNLEKSPPATAVESVQLMVEARVLRPAQNDLFLPPSPAPERLEAAIARIAALCGPERVGTLVPADSHRPEAVRLNRFAPAGPMPASRTESSPIEVEASAADTARMVLRTIRPAEEIEVMGTRNLPEFVRGRSICARVISAAGPWRRQGEWWAAAQVPEDCAADAFQLYAPAAYARDYYQLALADGAVYRLYYDLFNGKWYVDGIYD